MRGVLLVLASVLLPWCASAELAVSPGARLTAPAGVCRNAAAAAERTANIPPQLLAAIARVESGRYDRVSDRIVPWPWTINFEGQSSYFESKEQAIAAVRTLQAQGARSIDVGCLQVNLMHHPNAFMSLEQAFDPSINAAYAARFLSTLRDRTGDWVGAAAQYHSMTPDLGADYRKKVLVAWPEEQRLAMASRMIGLAANSGQVIAPALSRSGTPLPGLATPVRLLQVRLAQPRTPASAR